MRKSAALAAAVAMSSWCLVGCANDATRYPPLPSEFAYACGHPGATVAVTKFPLIVAQATCDLTGVIVRHELASVRVPAYGKAVSIVDTATGGYSIFVEVDADTGDVIIRG
ncbi:MAG: hypothetical protein DLM58_10550 [Pseudonocardiales bacterium]|nr:MAG: hypothetical protein DLM58_10550 [Pseudonocardiales bacterium]